MLDRLGEAADTAFAASPSHRRPPPGWASERNAYGDIVLTPTEPDDQTAGRIMLTCIFLIALVVAGFVVGLVWWPELMPWSR
jgi:hypothetical protein